MTLAAALEALVLGTTAGARPPVEAALAGMAVGLIGSLESPE
jgi:hypothetical protein